jgi:hypothetical protein
MSPNDDDAVVTAAFTRNKSITRWLGGCGLPTQAGVTVGGGAAFPQNAAKREWPRERRLASRGRSFRAYRVAIPPGE